jgi:hypothetical protein
VKLSPSIIIASKAVKRRKKLKSKIWTVKGTEISYKESLNQCQFTLKTKKEQILFKN